MRITNSMTTNTMLQNINRNATRANLYYNHLSTGKKIQVPSDDPLRASRALRFRTNVSETEQYQKNVAQGISWMEITEAAYRNINDILLDIRYLSVRAATDTLTYEDREKIITDINSLVEQIGLEMNVTYAGRYVFSGYRTDQPPVITKNEPELSYLDITQHFTTKDVQYTKVYHRDTTTVGGMPPSASSVFEVGIVKLAYANLTQDEFDRMRIDDSGGTNVLTSQNPTTVIDPNTGVAMPITVVSIEDADAYTRVGNYIRETGELVVSVPMPGETTPPLVTTPFSISYDILPASVTVVDPDDPDTVLGTLTGRGGLRKGELNPQIYFDCIDNTVGSPTITKRFNQSGDIPGVFPRQEFEFEFSINTRVRINSNAHDAFSAMMFADYQALLGVVKYINAYTNEEIQDLFVQQGLTGEALKDAVAQEMQKIQDALQARFSGLIGLVDKHISSVSTEHTDMGSRMRRLDLIQSRLDDDFISYTKLMSENEDVNLAEAIMKLSSLEAIYQASLAAGANIMRLTLANYI